MNQASDSPGNMPVFKSFVRKSQCKIKSQIDFCSTIFVALYDFRHFLYKDDGFSFGPFRRQGKTSIIRFPFHYFNYYFGKRELLSHVN